VRHANVVARPDLLDRAEDLGLPRTRDHAVLHVVRGKEAAHRGERALAPGPELLALERAGGPPERRRAALAADRLDARGRVVEPCREAVDLDEEDSAGVERVARADRGLDRLRREV